MMDNKAISEQILHNLTKDVDISFSKTADRFRLIGIVEKVLDGNKFKATPIQEMTGELLSLPNEGMIGKTVSFYTSNRSKCLGVIRDKVRTGLASGTNEYCSVEVYVIVDIDNDIHMINPINLIKVNEDDEDKDTQE